MIINDIAKWLSVATETCEFFLNKEGKQQATKFVVCFSFQTFSIFVIIFLKTVSILMALINWFTYCLNILDYFLFFLKSH